MCQKGNIYWCVLFYSSSNDSSSSKTSMSCGLLPHAWQCHCSCKVHGAQRQHSLEATVVLVSYVTKLQPAWKATGTACRCNFLHYTITEAATAVTAATVAVTTLPLRHAGQGGPAALYQDSFSTNRVRATATWVLLTSMCMRKQQQWARSCCLFAALVGVFVLCQTLGRCISSESQPHAPCHKFPHDRPRAGHHDGGEPCGEPHCTHKLQNRSRGLAGRANAAASLPGHRVCAQRSNLLSRSHWGQADLTNLYQPLSWDCETCSAFAMHNMSALLSKHHNEVQPCAVQQCAQQQPAGM